MDKKEIADNIEYDRSKDRQGLYDEVFFKKLYKDNLWLLDIAIKSMENYPNDAPEQIPAQIYLLTMIEYTAGHPIESVLQRF